MKFTLWTVPVSNHIPTGRSLGTMNLLLQTSALSHTKTYHFFMIRTIDSAIYPTQSMQLTDAFNTSEIFYTTSECL